MRNSESTPSGSDPEPFRKKPSEGGTGLRIYFAPMEGLTDGILRQAHNKIFGGIDVYCLPFHKLTQSLSLLTREKRDIAPEENEGLNILPQALTRDPGQLSAWLYYVSECGYSCADLNIGCPSPTVTKRGRGSGLLADPGYLRTFLDRVPCGDRLSKLRRGGSRRQAAPHNSCRGARKDHLLCQHAARKGCKPPLLGCRGDRSCTIHQLDWQHQQRGHRDYQSIPCRSGYGVICRQGDRYPLRRRVSACDDCPCTRPADTRHSARRADSFSRYSDTIRDMSTIGRSCS